MYITITTIDSTPLFMPLSVTFMYNMGDKVTFP